jgi:tRNA(Ile)-lysidine synthase
MVKGSGCQEPLADRVLQFIGENHLVPSKHPLLVAVSGGQDSVCLIHILSTIQRELDITLHVAHLDHQLRGAESEADAQYVTELARQLGVPATIERRDVKAYQVQQHVSMEEAAREVRYAFLAEVASSVAADRVAVGHTRDDHIETVLMHLVRGTGIRGLRGLQPVSRWLSSGDSLTIIRPLLEVSRQETAGYCHQHKLMPRVDASNLSLSLLRNRIRHQLLPLLQSYNPGVDEAILRTARVAGDALAYLDRETSQLWGEIAQRQENTITLDKTGFLELPSTLQRHLLRTAIEELTGTLKDIEERHIESVMAALTRPAGRRLNLPGGLLFCIEYDKYLLGRDVAALCPFPSLSKEFNLRIPGETALPGWNVRATIEEPERLADKGDNFTASFDLSKTGSNLKVRCRQPGDRFQPLGMSELKKVGEFMIDAKIPRSWRQRIPLVCSSHDILWIVGYRIDNRVRVTEETAQVLRLKFELVSNTHNDGQAVL